MGFRGLAIYTVFTGSHDPVSDGDALAVIGISITRNSGLKIRSISAGLEHNND